MQMPKREQTMGVGDMLPAENLKFKSSEMAKNASKTVNSNVNFFKQRVTTWTSCLTKI